MVEVDRLLKQDEKKQEGFEEPVTSVTVSFAGSSTEFSLNVRVTFFRIVRVMTVSNVVCLGRGGFLIEAMSVAVLLSSARIHGVTKKSVSMSLSDG